MGNVLGGDALDQVAAKCRWKVGLIVDTHHDLMIVRAIERGRVNNNMMVDASMRVYYYVGRNIIYDGKAATSDDAYIIYLQRIPRKVGGFNCESNRDVFASIDGDAPHIPSVEYGIAHPDD